jgi:hypothetical protein
VVHPPGDCVNGVLGDSDSVRHTALVQAVQESLSDLQLARGQMQSVDDSLPVLGAKQCEGVIVARDRSCPIPERWLEGLMHSKSAAGITGLLAAGLWAGRRPLLYSQWQLCSVHVRAFRKKILGTPYRRLPVKLGSLAAFT